MSIFGIDTAYYIDIIRNHWKGEVVKSINVNHKERLTSYKHSKALRHKTRVRDKNQKL